VKIYLIFFSLIAFCSVFPQVSETGNYEVYSREITSSSFGYFNTSFTPGEIYSGKLSQKGVSFTHFYDIWNVGNFPIDTENEISLYLTGEFKLGAAVGTPYILQEFTGIRDGVFKYYSASIDIFSLFFVPEYTLVMQNGNALRVKLGLHLLNFGGSFAFPENGVLKKHTLGTVNLIPLGFAPAVFFDFGRSGIGFTAYLNFTDVLSYNIAPYSIYGKELRGVKSFESIISRYDFQISFMF
jgi:hypothetical protein